MPLRRLLILVLLLAPGARMAAAHQLSNRGGSARPAAPPRRAFNPPFGAAKSSDSAAATPRPEAPIKLKPSLNTAKSRESAPRTPGGALTTAVSSLAVVMGLFFLVVYLSRRARPRGAGSLPVEAFEILGGAALASRQQVQLVRLGDKLLLLSVSANGVECLTEVGDQEEVDRLRGICREAQAGSASASFRNVLSQFADEPTNGDFVESDPIDGGGTASGYRSDSRIEERA